MALGDHLNQKTLILQPSPGKQNLRGTESKEIFERASKTMKECLRYGKDATDSYFKIT